MLRLASSCRCRGCQGYSAPTTLGESQTPGKSAERTRVKMPGGVKMPSECPDTNGWAATQKLISRSCRQLQRLVVRNIKWLILRGPVGARSETMTALLAVCDRKASGWCILPVWYWNAVVMEQDCLLSRWVYGKDCSQRTKWNKK